MNRRVLVRATLMVVATACFVAIFARFSDLAGIRRLVAAADSTLLLAGAAVTVVTITLRAFRASLAVDGRGSLELMAASAVHNAMTALLPMKLGELVLPYYLLRLGRAPVVEGIGVLLVLRVLDLASLVIVGSLAIMLALDDLPGPLGLAGTVVAAGTLVAVLANWGKVARLLEGMAVVRRWPVLARLVSVAAGIPRARLLWMFACSLLIWLSLFTALYCLAASVQPALTPFEAAAAGAAASAAFAFPISGVANTGPFQAAWLWMSLLLGLDATASLAASLVAHGTVVLVTTLLGLVAFVPLQLHVRHHAAQGGPAP